MSCPRFSHGLRVPPYADSAARVTVIETVRRPGELGVGAPFDLVDEGHPVEGLLLVDTRGRLTYANPAAATLLGARTPLSGLDLFVVRPDLESTPHGTALRSVLRDSARAGGAFVVIPDEFGLLWRIIGTADGAAVIISPRESDTGSSAATPAVASSALQESEMAARFASDRVRSVDNHGVSLESVLTGAASLLDAVGALAGTLDETQAVVTEACWGTLEFCERSGFTLTPWLAEALAAGDASIRAPDGALAFLCHGPLGVALRRRPVLIAPLSLGATLAGALVFVKPEGATFTDAHAELAERFAVHGADLLRNRALMAHAVESARVSRVLADVVREINQSLDLERIFSLIARHGAELLGANNSGVTTLEGETLVVRATQGSHVFDVGTRLPVDGVFSGEAVRTRRPVRTTNLAASPAFRLSAEVVGERRTNAIAVPLLVGGRPIGAIIVFGNAHRDFDEHDEELLMAMAGHAAVAIENGRLYRDAARLARHASILAATSRSLALHVTPQSLYADIAAVAMESIGAAGMSLYLADPETLKVELAHSAGAGGLDRLDVTPTFWDLQGGEVVRAAAPVFVSDLAEGSDDEATGVRDDLFDRGVRSLALLPMLVEGRSRGLLALRFAERHDFDESERQLLRDFGLQVAVAMRNASSFAALDQRATRLTAVATVQQAISASVSIERVYAEVYRAVALVVDAPCFVFLSAGEGDEVFVPRYMVVDHQELRPLSPEPIAMSGLVAAEVHRTGLARISRQPQRWWSSTQFDRNSDTQLRAELDVPVEFGGRKLGVIQVLSYDASTYTDGDIDLVRLLAQQAAVAIENARLFESQRRERELAEAAATIAQAALESTRVAEAAQVILARLSLLVQCVGMTLGIASDDGQTLHYVAAHGAVAAEAGRLVPLPWSAGPDEGATPSATGAGQERDPDEFVVPLVSQQRLLGAISVRSPTGGTLSEIDRDALERLATPTALAIDVLLLNEKEAQHRERERMLATALATMAQPVFVLSNSGEIRYANAAAEQEYGYSHEELGGMRAADIVTLAHGLPAASVGAESDDMLTTEHVHRRRNGSEFPAAVTRNRIMSASGEAVGQVLNVRNLTTERRIEDQLRQSEKLAALGELVAGVAHELNNPLTGISAFAQLLLEEDLTAEQDESVRMIKREADRAVTVIRDLLLFSRKTGPRQVAIDLNALLQQTIRLRLYSLRSAGVEVHYDLATDLPTVAGDDQKLQQVFLNLLVNAEHAMQRSALRTLTVRTRRDAAGVSIMIGDTGLGMTPDVASHIFEPFYTTKVAGDGTGLGLSVSYGIIQAHHGTIEVTSAPGMGSAFTLHLPRGVVDAPLVVTDE